MPINRARPPLTHFLAIPLYNKSSITALTASISEFIKETTSTGENKADASSSATDGPTKSPGDEISGAIKNSNYQGNTESHGSMASSRPPMLLPPGAIRPPSTLHLTLGVMSLTEPDLLETAVSMLKAMDMKEVLEGSMPPASGQGNAATETANEPIKVELQGLVPMQDASASTVLYAAPHDNSGRLLGFCQTLRSKFTEERLLVPDKRELKLHATVVNTIYAKGQRRGKNGRKEAAKIDARELIDSWEDYVWGEVTLEKVVICEMGAKEDHEGIVRYHEIAEAPIALKRDA